MEAPILYLFNRASDGQWIFGKNTDCEVAAGQFRLVPSADRTTVDVYQYKLKRSLYYRVPVTNFKDENGNSYATFNDLKAAYLGFAQQGSLLNLKSLLDDGLTSAYYDRTIAEGVVKDENGVESIYWDLMVGHSLRSEEQVSGNIILYAVYEITATTTNFFYTGCQVGDIFPCGVVKTCSDTNKVKRVLGNHLTQPVFARRFVNGVSDGIDDFMKTAPFTLEQPSMIYAIMKQNTWTANDKFFDGNLVDSSFIRQAPTSSLIRPYAGSYGTANSNMLIDKYSVVRCLFNGINSKMIINNSPPTTGNFGDLDMNGFTLGSGGNGGDHFSNISVNTIILRKSDEKESNIFSLLKKKSPDYINYSSKVLFTFDDFGASHYSKAFPLFVEKGISGTFYVPTLNMTETQWQQIKEMSDLGFDMESHSDTHVDLRTFTDVQLREQFDNVSSKFLANDIPSPNHFAYPGGLYNDLVKSISAEYYFTGRTNATTGGLFYPYNDKFVIPSLQLEDASTFSGLKPIIDNAKKYGQFLSFTIHTVYFDGVESSPGADSVKYSLLSEIIDYVKSINVDILTISQVYGLMD